MTEKELSVLLIGSVMSIGISIMAFLQYRIYKKREQSLEGENE